MKRLLVVCLIGMAGLSACGTAGYTDSSSVSTDWLKTGYCSDWNSNMSSSDKSALVDEMFSDVNKSASQSDKDTVETDIGSLCSNPGDKLSVVAATVYVDDGYASK